MYDINADEMAALDNQSTYWGSTGATKTFSHPVDFTWLRRLDRQSPILDYGCGYGRVVAELAAQGFRNVEGVDVSAEMIARARQEQPGRRFTVLEDPPRLPHDDRSVGAVVLFAVLTCIPTDTGQRELISELRRVLRPGGIVYISDLCLQSDERSRSRYAEHAARYGTYGVFETGEGAVFRHHTPEWLAHLLTDFRHDATQEIDVTTMNGHRARATQVLIRA